MTASLIRATTCAFLAIHCMVSEAAAATDAVKDQVRAYRAANEKLILQEFSDMLGLPNVATNVGDIERNATFIRRALERRGFRTELLSAGTGTPPSIYGELSPRNF